MVQNTESRSVSACFDMFLVGIWWMKTSVLPTSKTPPRMSGSLKIIMGSPALNSIPALKLIPWRREGYIRRHNGVCAARPELASRRNKLFETENYSTGTMPCHSQNFFQRRVVRIVTSNPGGRGRRMMACVAQDDAWAVADLRRLCAQAGAADIEVTAGLGVREDLENPIVGALNTKPKYVASNTLTGPRSANTTVLSGDTRKS
jgi:hypothetical protein